MWNWSFGDGAWFNTTEASAKNATHTYSDVGTYPVNFTSSNAYDTNTTVKLAYITANQIPAPVASFTATPLTGTYPPAVPVTFTDTSTNNPTSWLWQYQNETVGMTTFSTEQNPTFPFVTGTYDIYMKATNAGGDDDEYHFGYIVISPVPAPLASFTATPLTGTYPPAVPVTFTDTSTNNPTSWEWKYQNDTVEFTTFSTEQNPVYSFVTGLYDIQMIATNDGGQDDYIELNYINITPIPAPVANFTATPLSGNSPPAVPVTFTDLSTNSPTSWVWQYQNATVGLTVFSTDQNPTFSFVTGEYDIVLTATNSGGDGIKNRFGYISIGVSPPPTASFTSDITTGYSPLSVQFTDTSTDLPTGWDWYWFDNETKSSTDQDPAAIFSTVGLHSVRLYASNAQGGDWYNETDYIEVKSGTGYHMRPKASATFSRTGDYSPPVPTGTYVMREKATATMVTIAAEGRLTNILDGLGLGNVTPSNTTVIDPKVLITESVGVYTDALGPVALVLIFLIPFAVLFISQRSMRGASVLGVLASLFVFMYLPANYQAGAAVCIVLSVMGLGYSLWKGQG
jgi:PKD repeat protein